MRVIARLNWVDLSYKEPHLVRRFASTAEKISSTLTIRDAKDGVPENAVVSVENRKAEVHGSMYAEFVDDGCYECPQTVDARPPWGSIQMSRESLPLSATV